MLKLRKSVDILSVIGHRDKEYGIKKLEKEEPIVLFCRAHDIIHTFVMVPQGECV